MRVRGKCQAKVSNQRFPFIAHQDIGRLDVAVDHTAGVGVNQAAAYTNRYFNSAFDGQRLCQYFTQHRPRYVLHDDQVAMHWIVADVVDPHNGRMVKTRQRLSFILDKVRINITEQQTFDRDGSIQLMIVR